MVKYCVKCGCILLLNKTQNYWCPNCGILLDNQESFSSKNNEEKQKDSKEKTDYTR